MRISSLPYSFQCDPLADLPSGSDKEERLSHTSPPRALLTTCWLVMLLLCLGAAPLWAETSLLILDPDDTPHNATPYTSYVIDDYAPRDVDYTGVSLDEVLPLDQDGRFEPVSSREIGFGRIWNLVHLKTRVKNPQNAPQTWVLASNTSYRNLMTVYLLVEGEEAPARPIYQNLKHSEWRGFDVQPHVVFTLPAKATATVYVSYANASSSLPLTFEIEESYNDRRRIETISIFVQIAIALGFASVAVVFMIAIGHAATVPYTVYVLALAVSSLDLGGHLYLFFPSPLIADTIFVESVFFNLMLIGLLFFQRAYLMGENAVPRYCNFLKIAAIFPVIFAIGDLLLPRPIPGLITYPVTALLFTLSPITGVIACRRNMRGGIPFLLGSIALTASIYWLVISAFLTDTYLLTLAHALARYAFMFEVFMFALALFYQVRGLRIDTENSLRAEIRATKDKLAMAEALSSAAHDMQQPLTSLRLAMREVKGTTRSDVDAAFDYLDEMLRRNIADLKPAKATLSKDPLLAHAPPVAADNEETDETFEVSIILTHAYNMFVDEAAAKGLELRMVPSTLQSSGSVFVLMRIVTNLLSNAIKNTAKGKIVLGARNAGSAIRLEIHDSGRGMPEAVVQHIMQPYERTGDYPGSGLGLAIVRQLSDENGYKFDLHSVPAKGTTARITIPKAEG